MCNTDYGHLILSLHLHTEEDGDTGSTEAIYLLAHNPDGGDPLPVFIELADGLKACRCGAALRRARVRIVAPKSVPISRVPHEEIP